MSDDFYGLIPSSSQDAPSWEEATFLARLTAVYTPSSGAQASLNLYSFIEQTTDPLTGIPADANPSRQTIGASPPTANYALEAGNQLLTVPGNTPAGYTNPGPYVEIRLKSMVNGAPVYEFQAPGSSGGGSALAVYNGVTEIDAAVTRIDADTNSVLTWSEVASGHVQYVVAAATASQDGVVTTTAQTWGGSKTTNGFFQAGTTYPYARLIPNEVVAGSSFPGIVAENSASDPQPMAFVFDSANQRGILASVGGAFSTTYPSFALVNPDGTEIVGVTGTGGGGDTFTGGICTALGSGGGVTSLNGETGAVSIVAGAGITVTPSGSNITIAATGSGNLGTHGTVGVSGVSVGASAAAVTGATVTLPNAGTYLLTCDVTAEMFSTSQGDSLTIYLYDSTAATIITATTRVAVTVIVTGTGNWGNASINIPYVTAAAGHVIQLYGSYSALGTSSTHLIEQAQLSYMEMI